MKTVLVVGLVIIFFSFVITNFAQKKDPCAGYLNLIKQEVRNAKAVNQMLFPGDHRAERFVAYEAAFSNIVAYLDCKEQQ